MASRSRHLVRGATLTFDIVALHLFQTDSGDPVMRYMLLVYSQEMEMAKMPPEEFDRISAAHRAVMEETAKLGIFRGAEPLKPTSTATTIRMQDSKPLIIDGPFAETKEQLAGYYILDCDNLDEAIGWAEKIPTGCKGGRGCIEIRPIIPVAQPGTYSFASGTREDLHKFFKDCRF